mmetsp:Transcript_30331/g.89974  ORF Transcript_30331/g.89974 Transcript_30331/m.89974 type:complete len:228 (-) Transcript_30331:40-723(-)
MSCSPVTCAGSNSTITWPVVSGPNETFETPCMDRSTTLTGPVDTMPRTQSVASPMVRASAPGVATVPDVAISPPALPPPRPPPLPPRPPLRPAQLLARLSPLSMVLESGASRCRSSSSSGPRRAPRCPPPRPGSCGAPSLAGNSPRALRTSRISMLPASLAPGALPERLVSLARRRKYHPAMPPPPPPPPGGPPGARAPSIAEPHSRVLAQSRASGGRSRQLCGTRD